MCIQKVKIKEQGHYLRNRYNYYNCGVCAACRQQAANSKVSKISSHQDPDTICYFVTLTYDNDHIPVCAKSDLKDLSSLYDNFGLPVYRGIYSNKVIDIIDFESFDDKLSIDTLKGVVLYRDKLNPENNILHDDFFSIALSSDIRNFIKRLRSSLSYSFKKTIPLKYFYSPEYGPDSFRFHAHLLIWLPNWLSLHEVREFIIKAWPYASADLLREQVDIALAAAHYVASYVNCSADIPKFLTSYFPLRQSHSLHFGYLTDNYTLASVLDAYQRGDFGYYSTSTLKDGTVKENYFLYSKSLISRYFPKIKGFSRLPYATLLNAYSEPQKYITFAKQPIFLKSSNGFQHFDRLFLDYCSGRDVWFYKTSLVDTYGLPVSMSEKELKYTVKRIDNAVSRIQRYLQLRNHEINKIINPTLSLDDIVIPRVDAARLLIDYLLRRDIFLYKREVTYFSGDQQLFCFNNLSEIDKTSIPTLLDILYNSLPDFSDPSLNPINLHTHNELLKMYNANIKHRKINHLR